MGVKSQATGWQLTPISNCHCVRELGGFCCVLMGQNRPSNTQQALHKNDKNNGGGNNKKNIFLVAPATPTPQGQKFWLPVTIHDSPFSYATASHTSPPPHSWSKWRQRWHSGAKEG
eukprot:10181365-Ditylum_brightwellii.AAC.1